jgi:hypothetical protein
MAIRSTTQDCTVKVNWEWVITGYTPVTTTTTRKSVTTSQRWKYYAMFDAWAKDGSLSYEGTNFVETVAPSYPGGASADGATIYTSGSGMADVTTTSGGDPIHGWRSSSTLHGHDSSVYYDDGSYAGTLPHTGCTGAASAPSFNGSYVGQTAQTTGSGTASYSGDIPAKGGGGDPDPPSLALAVTNINDTSVRGVIQNLQFQANYYHLFEFELWRGDEAEYLITDTWTDSGSVNYTYKDFSGLNSGTTYTIKAWVKSTPTNRVYVGKQVFTTTGAAVTRPSDWAWKTLTPSAVTYTSSGKVRLNLVQATEWNNFFLKINEFRKYKKLASTSFTNAVSSGDFTSAMYEEAKSAISNMGTVNVPTGFYSKLVALKDALNSIQ